jgi:hypothetical protein
MPNTNSTLKNRPESAAAPCLESPEIYPDGTQQRLCSVAAALQGASTDAEISPRALEASIGVCHANARQLLNELREIIRLLPNDDSVYGCVRAELDEAEGYIWPALDYLAPRADDNDPECCAHRALRGAADYTVQP